MLLTLSRLLLPTIIVTGLAGTVYITGQQMLRQNANDPQIQIAEDAAVALEIGVDPSSLIPPMQTEIERSTSPFIAVYDGGGVPVVSSALLSGQLPKLPDGIFTNVQQGGEDRVTWEPKPGVRIAIVVQKYSGQHTGFVAVGRSLREVENRIQELGLLAAGGWLATLLALGAAEWLLGRKKTLKS